MADRGVHAGMYPDGRFFSSGGRGQVRVRAVTKEGDVYDPAGTVEGGSARDILQFSPNSHGIFSSLERCRFLRPEDACPQRFSWFFNWIPKVQRVQKRVNLIDLVKSFQTSI